jgi:hypothetical protein
MVQGLQGYLQGNSTLTTQQKLVELRLADQQVAGLLDSIVPNAPTNLPAQPMPSQLTQPIPAYIGASGVATISKTPQNTSNNITSTTVNLGVGGDLIVKSREFQITYVDVTGAQKTFSFSLLPAIETNLRSNHMGATVPEVKPGILVKTSMSYKRFAIPGSAPVFQSLGIEQTILQVVGLFIGTEGEVAGSPDPVVYGRFADTIAYTSALSKAQQFDQQVVQSGREVGLYIYAESTGANDGMLLQYKCIIQNFRFFVVRSDRVYYSMDAIVLDYRTQRLPLSLAKPPKQITAASFDTSTNAGKVGATVAGIAEAARAFTSPQSDVIPSQENLKLD